MGKVKEEYHYPVYDESLKKQADSYYVLLDVADDEEGYGVVFGGDATDRTIAFGYGELNVQIAFMLFVAIQNEIEGIILEKGKITEEMNFSFQELETPYDWESKQVAADKSTCRDMLKIMKYISTYHPYL